MLDSSNVRGTLELEPKKKRKKQEKRRSKHRERSKESSHFHFLARMTWSRMIKNESPIIESILVFFFFANQIPE